MSVQQVERFWLHDDSEEDLLGTDWQQRAIVQTYDALHGVAMRQHLPWHIGNQLPLAAWTPEQTSWRPSPDIMVHPTAGAAPRMEMSARSDDPPTLVIEVLSATTWRYDVDDVGGKAAGYMALGVLEYLTFDPMGEFLETPCRGWRLENGTVRSWEPEADGSYWSRALSIGLRPEGAFLRVIDGQGRAVPTYEEQRRHSDTLARDNDALMREVAAREQELAARDQEIAALRAAFAQLREQGSAVDEADDTGQA